MKKNIQEYDKSMVSVDVSITSFFTAVATFFTGFLISNYAAYDRSVRIPIIFLVVSTFAFLFTTNIFGNALGEILSGRAERAKKNAAVGTIISEFLGVYLLVLAIPLAINALTNDMVLRYSVFVVSSAGLFTYSNSRFSVITRYVSGRIARFLYAGGLISLSAIAFFSQGPDNILYLLSSAAVLVYLLVTTYLTSSQKVHYSDVVE